MKLTGGEIIVKTLVKEKVPYVLGIPGHGVLCFFDALRKEEKEGNIKYIQVKHEETAAFIADGYYRTCGRPLATFSSIGPGTLNMAIGLATAYVDSSAFLEICGDTHTRMKGVGVLQEIERYQDSNIIRSLEPLSKRVWRVENILQLPKIMHRSFNLMTSGRVGPVTVSVPMDIQGESLDCELMKNEEESTKAMPCADPIYIDEALKLMSNAKRPVILVGGGALKARVNEKIIALAKLWGAGVITTLEAKGAVSERFDQYCFHTGSKGTKIGVQIATSADVILALGSRFADETCSSYRKGKAFNFPDTKLIQVDIDSGEIGKNYPVNVGILSDCKDALDKLIEKFPVDYQINQEYLKEIHLLRYRWFRYLEFNRKTSSKNLTISQLIGVLNRKLPSDAIISSSSGNTQAQLFQEYIYKEPYCNLTTGGFSTMGWAFPAALGAKLAAKDRTVVALMGDGDFMMVMQELSTMVEYNIPVIIVMANNSGWMAIKDLQMDAFGENYHFGNDFLKDGKRYSPDFIQIAKAFGVNAYNAVNINELNNALDTALKEKKPAFINVEVERDYPLTGGKTFGWWDVPIPTYFKEKRENYEKSIKEEQL